MPTVENGTARRRSRPRPSTSGAAVVAAFEHEKSLGEAACARRQRGAAMVHLRRAIRIAEAAGLGVHAARARVVLAGALAMGGDFDGAARETDRAATVLRGGDLARNNLAKALAATK